MHTKSIDRFGIIIDKEGFKIGFYQLDEDNNPIGYKLKGLEQIIEKDWSTANGMNKPQWQEDTETWLDTEPLVPRYDKPSRPDEIQILEGQVATLEVMGVGLLLENANQQVKIQEQEVTNANMLLELASLKGGM